MDPIWVGERAAIPDVKLTIRNTLTKTVAGNWGPNATFRFPAKDGTGGIWKAVANTLPKERFRMNTTVTKINSKDKIAHFSDGTRIGYRCMISTMPLDEICEIVDGMGDEEKTHSRGLIYSSTHVIGIGIRGTRPERIGDKCWLYLYVLMTYLMRSKI
jgi:protoporphyrinogen oxidase